MIRFRRYARPAFRYDGARFPERHGPIIEHRQPGTIGWLKSLNLGQFMLLCIAICVAVLIAIPVLSVLVLVIADAR